MLWGKRRRVVLLDKQGFGCTQQERGCGLRQDLLHGQSTEAIRNFSWILGIFRCVGRVREDMCVILGCTSAFLQRKTNSQFSFSLYWRAKIRAAKYVPIVFQGDRCRASELEKKIIGVATDGAPSMTGPLQGLRKEWKRNRPRILSSVVRRSPA